MRAQRFPRVLVLAMGLLLGAGGLTACGGGGGGDEGGGGADTAGPGADAPGGFGDGGGGACSDECPVLGARRCGAEGIEICGVFDDDDCLDWGDGGTCGKDTACVDGYCQPTCADECDLAGERRCDGNVAQTCGAHDEDPCLEWGADSDCGATSTCADGYCVTGCTNDCPASGERRCNGNVAEACGQHDADPCLEWGDGEDCGAETCADGYCASGCSDECPASGERRCDGNAAQVCGDHDADPCLEWSAGDDCGEGVCADGFCGLACDDDCTVNGARRCTEGGFEVCGNSDADPCLEWGTAVACPDGQTCSNGHCRSDCVDECTVVGARRCDGTGGYAVCGSYDADGCLEWGTAVACAQGEVCSNGWCATSCTSECSLVGAQRCNGQAVQTCGDANHDGCLEWGTPVPCGAEESCSNGFCATSCTPECTVAGARRCSGDAVETCGDADEDGCLEWGTAVPCGATESCSNGFCATGCTSECTVAGAVRCSGSAVETCGDADQDGCLEWGTPDPCEPGETCSDGHCSAVCSNECTVLGARRCQGDAVQVCGDTDADPCLEWGTPEPCAATQTCSNGHCALDCENECTLVGARQCASTGAWQECADHDGDGCLDWSTPTGCLAGETCSGGSCVSGCVSECTYLGARRCDPSGLGWQSCGDANDDGCLEWGSATLCPGGTTCSAGVCTLECTNECTVAGSRRCGGPAAHETCGDHDDDGCLEWGSALPCADGEVCSDGNCAVDCADECATVGERQCAATGAAWQSCDDYDQDGCLEWGSEVSCEAGLVCADGFCAASCTSQCEVVGGTRCNQAGTGVQTCGDANDDGCLEWGNTVPCGDAEVCDAGACEAVPVPGEVLISEVLYDGVGADTDVFVELYGDPGLDLSGFTLVGVNGSNNQAYQPIALSGSIPADGFFVIAHPSAGAALAAAADLLDAAVDYQNGPDSVQLRWGATVVDAVGYGDFTGAYFAGEGAPALDVAEGHSLTRDGSATDTDDNASDFADAAVPTPGAWSGAPNQRPTAVLACPTGGGVGDTLTFDAGASTDADGTIAEYRFAFGDGAVTTGPAATAVHAYAAPDSYTVTLTVVDDRGALDTVTCAVAVSDPSAPRVVWVRPLEDLVVTQGDSVGLAVDVSPGPGRRVASATLVVNGADHGVPLEALPYAFTYVVPADAPTGGTTTLQVRATDDQGVSGWSPVRTLSIVNDPPVASFVAYVSGDLEVTVDATGSSDTETAAAALEVRWDWDADGTWDTPWSTTKGATHVYPAEGQHTIVVQVRDAVGQTDTATRTVDFQSIQSVSGAITTTYWNGTVYITGDAWVVAGNTLTIAPGTTVFFWDTDDAPADGVGDYDLVIHGTLDVQGTADDPVVFTVDGTNRNARAWNKVQLAADSSGSTIRHAIFEYGDIALEVRSDATIENCEFRFSRIGLSVASTDDVTLTDCTAHDATSHGVQLSSAVVTASGLVSRDNGGNGVDAANSDGTTLTACSVTGNTGHGFRVDRSDLDVSDCSVTDNGRTGFELWGNSAGRIFHSQIKYNGEEGVRALPLSGASPTTTVEWNNVFGNATVGALVVETVNLTAASTDSGTTDPQSGLFSTPGGEPILMVEATYSENYSSTSLTGYVRNQSGSSILTFAAYAAPAWTDVSSYGATGVRAAVVDDLSYGAATMTVSRVAYVKQGAVQQVAVVSAGQTLVARHLYLGGWPDVLPLVTYTGAAHLDLQGFVREAFDATWSPGDTRGGLTIASDTTWDTDVYVTGHVTVASGATLTIPAGVTVRFVPTDQNGDAQGDWSIDRGAGTLAVQGTAVSPVLFTVLGSAPAGGGFQWVGGTGGGALDMAWATVEQGRHGVWLTSGTAVLDQVTLRDNVQAGLRMSSAAAATTTGLQLTTNGTDGAYLTGTGARTFDRLVAEGNAGWGVFLTQATAAGNRISDATITDNGAGGVHFYRSNGDLNYSDIRRNGFGVQLSGQTAGTISYNYILNNDSDGVFVTFVSTAQPGHVVSWNNIAFNGQQEGAWAQDAPLSVSSTDSGTTDPVSSLFDTGGPTLEFVKVSYNENYSSTSLTGYVLAGTGGGTLLTFPAYQALTWHDIAASAQSSVRLQIVDDLSYGGASLTMTRAFWHAPAPAAPDTRYVELAAVLLSAGFNATHNWWGPGGSPSSRIIQSDSGLVDFSGAEVQEITTAGPRL